MRRIGAAAALSLLVVVPLAADRLEDEAKRLEAKLIAPCCWTQQVSLHQSEAAAEIKREIRVALREGRTGEQILDGYVQRYGTQILAEPPARGFAAWLYVLPIVTLVLSAGGLALIVKRFARRGATAPETVADRGPTDSGEMADRLDDELRDLD